jgi:predicted AAA+ superfamily ATPase
MIYRDIIDRIRPWLAQDLVIILKGARQVGKTTLLYLLKKELEAQGQIVHYIAADLDFADPAFGDPRLFIMRLDDIFQKRPGTVMIDEFQIIPRAGLFLKTVFDQTRDRYQFIVSGSSSLELTKNAESLTGRKKEFIVRPLSFLEFVRARLPQVPIRRFEIAELDGLRDFAALYGSLLKEAYAEYLTIGGYPAPVLAPAEIRVDMLRELLATYLRNDVAGYLRVENISGFNNLVRLLCSQIGSQMNKSELGSTLRLNAETVNRYLDMLEGTFVFSFVQPWFSNPRKEVRKMPKVYVNDPGILIASGAKTATKSAYDLLDGHIVENAVFRSLSECADKIRYWRTVGGAEVDFIVENENGVVPIEVKFTAAKPGETVAMRNFRAAYPQALRGIVVSKDVIDNGNVLVVPAYLFDFINRSNRSNGMNRIRQDRRDE